MGFYDEGVTGDMADALGFMTTGANWRIGHTGFFRGGNPE